LKYRFILLIIKTVMSSSLLDKFISALSPSPGERRKEHRRKEDLPVEIEVLSDDVRHEHSKITLNARITNISAGGLKIQAEKYLSTDTLVRLKISLPKSQKSIHPLGRVVWGNHLENQKMYEMGIEFKKTPPDILGILLEHIYTDWD
jgi:uncharacterized protein (TIGR02266 family)